MSKHRRNQPKRFSIPAAAVAGALASSAFAASLTWDSSGANFATPVDGAGTWNLSNTNWSNGSANVTWDNLSTAVFGSNGTAGVVTINDPALTVTAAGLTFSAVASGSYTIAAAAGNSLTLATNAIINIAPSFSGTISAPIAGSVGTTVTTTLGGLGIAGGGTLNLSGVSTYSGDTYIRDNSVVNLTGSGSFGTAAGKIFVGMIPTGSTATDTSVLNMSGTSSITAGTLYIDYNQAHITASTTAGSTLNVNGTNTINADNIIVTAGHGNGSTKGGFGRLLLGSGATLTLNGSAGSGAVGLLDIADYSFETGGGTGTGTAGTVDFSPGTVNGTITTINIATGKPGTTTNSGGIANGTLTFANGALNADTINIARVGRQSANGILNLAAGGTGTLAVGAGGITFGAQGPTGTVGTTGTININGATLSVGNNIVNSNASASGTTGTINLAGGTLNMNGFSIGAATAGNTLTVNLNSGTLRALGGGGINGAGLAKSTLGILRLDGANTYTGNTSISGGTLAVVGSTPAGSAVSVSSGGTLGGTGNGVTTGVVAAPVDVAGGFVRAGVNNGDVGTLTMPALTIHTGGINVDLGASFAADLLKVNGALTLGDPAGPGLSMSVAGVTPSIGDYEIVDYTGTLTQNAAFAINGPLGFNYSLNTGTSGKIFLHVTAGAPVLTWNGAADLTTWNHTAANFTNGTSNVAYTDGQIASFNDTAPAGATTVNLTETVSTAGVSVNSNTNNYTFQGVGAIAGTGVLVKDGSSTLTILNNNTYSGVTTINNGSIVVGNGGTSGALGSGNVTDNDTLTYNRSDTATVVNNISGTGNFIQASTGTLILTGANSYTGTTAVNAGTLQVGAGGTAGTLGAGPISLGSDTTLAFNRSDALAVSAIISGSGSVRKMGGGTTTLSGVNTYTGPTTINGGSLSISSLTNIGTASGIGAGVSASNAASLVLDGGTLRWTGGANQTSNRLFTLGVNGGGLDASPTGGFALTLNATAGAVAFSGTGPRTLTLTGTDPNPTSPTTQVMNLIIADQDPITGKTSVVKTGNGAWSLGAANTYTGGTTINAGRVRANTVNAFGGDATNLTNVSVASGGQAFLNVTGDFNNNFSIAGIGISENIAADTTAGFPLGNFGAIRLAIDGTNVKGTVTLAADARITARGAVAAGGIVSGKITGAHALEFGPQGNSAAVVNLSNAAGTNDWSGDTTVNAGTVKLGAADQIPNGASKGNVTINGTAPVSANLFATLDLGGFSETINGLSSAGDVAHVRVQNSGAAATLTVGDNNATASFAGTLQDSGGALAITKIGAGTQALSGANTYSGGTTVSAGKLSVGPAAIPVNNVVTVNGGEYEMGQGGGAYKPASLTINAGGKASMAANGASVLDTSAINIAGTTDAWSGQLDVKDNDAILRSSDVNRVGDTARINNQLKQGLNATTNSNTALFWTGNGIITSSGWKGGSNYTGIGVTYNDFAAVGQPSAPIYTSFDGQAVGVNDVLVKYTWFGDADLSGSVTSNDYFQIDTGFLAHRTGWINGDFDYNGVINSNDYFLIDSAFLAQGNTVFAPSAAAAIPASSSSSVLGGVTAVPEPASLGLLALAGAGALTRRSRRR